MIETILQAHFVSVSCCKTDPLRPGNNSSCPTQGCGPTPCPGAASVPGFDWLSSCHRARSLGVAFSQFSSYGVSLCLFMAQVRGRATEPLRRHAEDEENDDGWSAALVFVAEVFVVACVVLAIPHQGETCVTAGAGYWLIRKGLGSSGSRSLTAVFSTSFLPY